MKNQQESRRKSIHRTSNGSTFAARTGAVSGLLLAAIASIFALGILGYLAAKIRPDAQTEKNDAKLVRVYCAAGVAEPVEQIAIAFNQLSGYEVQIARIGGSGELAGQIKTEIETDMPNPAQMFITNDEQMLKRPSMEGIYESQSVLATQRPVIAVSAETDQQISGVQELLETEMKFGIASKRAAIGLLARKIATQQNVLPELEQRKRLDAENVMVLAQALVTGSIDAAVVWDTTVGQINAQSDKPVLGIAGLADPSDQTTGRVAVGIVAAADESLGAQTFAKFLQTDESAKQVFRSFGFQPSFIEASSLADRANQIGSWSTK